MSGFDRIQQYYDIYAIPFLNLLNGEDLQSVNLNILSGDLFPISYLWEQFQNYEILPVFLGNGLGSASAVNNLNLDGYFGPANPNIQSIRLLFEHGLLSTINSFRVQSKSQLEVHRLM